jgi:hypothetical protein
MTALHPMDEKQYAWGVFQDKPDTECTTLDTATSPMVTIRVSDHRGSNSQTIDFESIKIYPIFTVKIKNPGKSNT